MEYKMRFFPRRIYLFVSFVANCVQIKKIAFTNHDFVISKGRPEKVTQDGYNIINLSETN